MPLNPLAAAAKKLVKDKAEDLIKQYVQDAIKYCTVQVVKGAAQNVPTTDELMAEVSEALDQTGADRLLPALVINALTLYDYPPIVRVKLARLTVSVGSLVVWVEYCKTIGLNPRNGSLEKGPGGIDPASILKAVGNMWDNFAMAGTVWTTLADWEGREKEMIVWQSQAAKDLTKGEDPDWPVIRGIKLNMYFGAVKGGGGGGHPMTCY